MPAAVHWVDVARLSDSRAWSSGVRWYLAKLAVLMASWKANDRRPAAADVPPAAATGGAAAAGRQGDGRGTGFQDLFIPHLDAAYNLARYLSRDADAAQDIVQEAYLRAFRAFDGYRGGDPRSWLLAIVRNCYRAWAGQQRREHARRAETMAQDEPDGGGGAVRLEEIADPDLETAEDALVRQGDVAVVRRIIKALPEPYREVLVLRELEELGYRQIAEIVEVPIGTVMSRLARARRLFGAAWFRDAGEMEGAE